MLASLSALWAMLRFVDSGRARDGALLGALVGLAMAPKVSVAPILAPLALTFLWVAKDRAQREWTQLRPADIARVVTVTALAGVVALATFFITTPYAFLDFANFIGDIREQAGMAGEAGRFPFTWQYADTPAFLYQIRQTAVWGLGLPLGIAVWVAAPVTAWFAWRGGVTQRSDLLLLAWAVPAFVFLELFEVKFLRYVFPLMPFYILMAARMLVAFVVWGRSRQWPVARVAEPAPDDAPFSEEWHATPPTVGDDSDLRRTAVWRRAVPGRAVFGGVARYAAAGRRNGRCECSAAILRTCHRERSVAIPLECSGFSHQPVCLSRQHRYRRRHLDSDRPLRHRVRRRVWPHSRCRCRLGLDKRQRFPQCVHHQRRFLLG